MKLHNVIWFSFLIGIACASEDDDTTLLIKDPVEIDIVLVCSEGTKHEGDEIPAWITTQNARDFYCDGPEEETQLGE